MRVDLDIPTAMKDAFVRRPRIHDATAAGASARRLLTVSSRFIPGKFVTISELVYRVSEKFEQLQLLRAYAIETVTGFLVNESRSYQAIVFGLSN